MARSCKACPAAAPSTRRTDARRRVTYRWLTQDVSCRELLGDDLHQDVLFGARSGASTTEVVDVAIDGPEPVALEEGGDGRRDRIGQDIRVCHWLLSPVPREAFDKSSSSMGAAVMP